MIHLQAEIRKKVEMCDEDVPVIALGGGSIDPAPPVATEVDSSDGFEALWRFVEAAEPLDTSSLQPFEGADIKWQKIIDAKDEVQSLCCAPSPHPPSPHPYPQIGADHFRPHV